MSSQAEPKTKALTNTLAQAGYGANPLAPTTIWYILFSFLPMFGIIIAFKNFRISGGF